MKQKLARIWGFIKRHKWSFILIIIALGVAGFILWDSFSAGTTINFGDMKLRPKPETRVRAPLSGKLVEKSLAERKPVAVVVENHPDARPQSGLNQASIVFETLAEGGITRFLAVFQEENPTEIGPIRSARPYFVDWALSYKALFAHVGGDFDALEMIKRLNVLDLNQFSFGSYYWRDNSRYAPHNAYSSMEKLYNAAKSKGYSTTDTSITPYSFKDEPKTEERPVATSFTVGFIGSYAVSYSYNPTDNFYYRSFGAQKQTDRVSKEQIKAKNVMVCFTDISNGRSKANEQMSIIRTTGTGRLSYFIDGVRKEGTWKRADRGQIKFLDAEGKDVVLNAGTTWVDIVPLATSVK